MALLLNGHRTQRLCHWMPACLPPGLATIRTAWFWSDKTITGWAVEWFVVTTSLLHFHWVICTLSGCVWVYACIDYPGSATHTRPHSERKNTSTAIHGHSRCWPITPRNHLHQHNHHQQSRRWMAISNNNNIQQQQPLHWTESALSLTGGAEYYWEAESAR